MDRSTRSYKRKAIHRRVRKKVAGTAARPRLAFYRSARHVYAQLVDDEAGHTLASASTAGKAAKAPKGANIVSAKAVGELIAAAAASKNIEVVVFDRGGFLYHGAVKAFADAARAKGLKF